MGDVFFSPLRLDIGVINPRGASNTTSIEAIPGRVASQLCICPVDEGQLVFKTY